MSTMLALGVFGIAFTVLCLLGRRLIQKKKRSWSPRDQRIVITGASSGIGRALALRWTSGGAHALIITARRRDALESVAAECEAINERVESDKKTRIVCVVGDVGKRDVCRDSIERCVQLFGGVDTVVANAGLSHSGWFADAREEDLDVVENMLQVNTMQCFYLSHYAMPHLLVDNAANGNGKKLCFISSMAGLIGSPGRAAYCASKFAVNGLGEALMAEIQLRDPDSPLNLTVICPGPVQTEINRTRFNFGGGKPVDLPFPPGTLTAEQAAEKIESALSCNVRVDVWMPAAHLVPFLRLFAPGLLDRILERMARKLLGSATLARNKEQ